MGIDEMVEKIEETRKDTKSRKEGIEKARIIVEAELRKYRRAFENGYSPKNSFCSPCIT